MVARPMNVIVRASPVANCCWLLLAAQLHIHWTVSHVNHILAVYTHKIAMMQRALYVNRFWWSVVGCAIVQLPCHHINFDQSWDQRDGINESLSNYQAVLMVIMSWHAVLLIALLIHVHVLTYSCNFLRAEVTERHVTRGSRQRCCSVK